MTTTYPVRVDARLDPGLTRWLWLVKWFLAIPHYLVLSLLWSAFGLLSVAAFLAILVTGRYPRALFDFNLGVLRWTWRVAYYTFGALATDRYPPFSLGEQPDYPATLHIAYPERLSRGLALVKWLLAVPHLVIVGVFLGGGGYLASRAGEWAVTPAGGLVGVFVLIAGVVLLFTGRYPRGVFDFVLGLDRWALRVAAYVGLMTDAYPPFRLDTGGEEPGTTTLDTPPDRPAPVHRTPPRGSTGRVVAAVLGVLLLVAGAGFSGAGTIALWADQTQRDPLGGLGPPARSLHTDAYALESGVFELHHQVGGMLGGGWMGEVRLSADSPVFLGIGPAGEVDRYLSAVERDRVVGVGAEPAYRHLAGEAPRTPPGLQRFWVASGTGSLTWQAEPGRWTAVVMNADGTRVVDTSVTASVTVPELGVVAWLLIGSGVLLLLLGGVLLFVAVIRPDQIRGETHA